MIEPSKEEMVDFLRDHFRYYTMNSWNRSKSYAKNVKINNLELTKAQRDKAYEAIYAEETFFGIDEILGNFAALHDNKYQMCFNGRSSGYLVLINGGQEPSGYQSFCQKCGQLSYAKVLPAADTPETEFRNFVRTHNHWIDDIILGQETAKGINVPEDRKRQIISEVRVELFKGDVKYTEDAKCGKCGKQGRVNFETTHMRTFSRPGQGIDEEDDFEECDEGTLKERYDLIKEFDATVDECIDNFKSILDNCNVVEETIMVPKKVMRLRCAKGEA